jgi:hypothetical protein
MTALDEGVETGPADANGTDVPEEVVDKSADVEVAPVIQSDAPAVDLPPFPVDISAAEASKNNASSTNDTPLQASPEASGTQLTQTSHVPTSLPTTTAPEIEPEATVPEPATASLGADDPQPVPLSPKVSLDPQKSPESALDPPVQPPSGPSTEIPAETPAALPDTSAQDSHEISPPAKVPDESRLDELAPSISTDASAEPINVEPPVEIPKIDPVIAETTLAVDTPGSETPTPDGDDADEDEPGTGTVTPVAEQSAQEPNASKGNKNKKKKKSKK